MRLLTALVAGALVSEDSETMAAIEQRIGRKIAIRPNRDFHVEQFEIAAA